MRVTDKTYQRPTAVHVQKTTRDLSVEDFIRLMNAINKHKK